MKIKSITIAAVFTILTAFIPSCSKTETKNSLPAPQITGSIDGNSIRFKIIIPENHHAYLDRGKEGRLIPISFDWKHALENEPAVQSAPPGNFDREVEATVLRGEGEFIFQTEGAVSLAGKTVNVRTQICDDIKGLCYRPTVEEVVIN